ncbi:hypothetical protein OIU34_20265 [Pararhizobium sp. BT-229]|uniref:hypothetical protein n=1 Tax=Pararhizobium sp. BT-229 TaxID=2986923 RepID=UPI0021F78052|nr:hypothetical protein [Pararhizobium sp. BT-229]MCV9964223.1 hypothetical protein [Pararhizobium sp. BT-229]
MRISVPFGYYRSEPGQLVSTPLVEFIDAEAPELSPGEVRPIASYRRYGDVVNCLSHDGDFLVSLGFNANVMPTPGIRRSPKAFQLLSLMPMFSGEPIHEACMRALGTGGGYELADGSPNENRNGRIERAQRVAESFVIVGRQVFRKVPEPKLKMTIMAGTIATTSIYFGGIHRDENGKANFREEYVLPFTISDRLGKLIETRRLDMRNEDVLEAIAAPDAFTFSATESVAETLALWVLKEIEKDLGGLGHEDISRWMDLRDISAGFGGFDHTVWNDIRGLASAEEVLDLVHPLSRRVADDNARERIVGMLDWVDGLDETPRPALPLTPTPGF